jgi:hypothetical protein
MILKDKMDNFPGLAQLNDELVQSMSNVVLDGAVRSRRTSC